MILPDQHKPTQSLDIRVKIGVALPQQCAHITAWFYVVEPFIFVVRPTAGRRTRCWHLCGSLVPSLDFIENRKQKPTSQPS